MKGEKEEGKAEEGRPREKRKEKGPTAAFVESRKTFFVWG